jgi:hypothetical protein
LEPRSRCHLRKLLGEPSVRSLPRNMSLKLASPRVCLFVSPCRLPAHAPFEWNWAGAQVCLGQDYLGSNVPVLFLQVGSISCISRCDRPGQGNDQHAGGNASAADLLSYPPRKSAMRIDLPIEKACLDADRQRKVVAEESNELVARCNCEAHLGQPARTTQHDDAL